MHMLLPLIGLSVLVLQTYGFRSTPQVSRKIYRYEAMTSKVSGVKEEKVFIFGLGYVGEALARQLKLLGYQVCGTCTNVNKALLFRNEGISTHLFDEISVKRGQLEAVQDLLDSQYVINTIPPFGEGSAARDLVLEAHADDLRRSALTEGGLKWIGYLSSTGVYGDCNGAWVRENHVLNPDSDKTIARAMCESRWRQLQERSGLPIHTFRLAGIYGPGRSALDTLMETIRERKPIPPADDVTFISRVHVEDIIQVLVTSMQHPNPGYIYNVADDLPSTRFDVLSYASRKAKFPEIQPSQRPLQSRGGSKRVDNAKVRQLLAEHGRSLRYPDYRSGIDSLVLLYQQQGKFSELQAQLIPPPGLSADDNTISSPRSMDDKNAVRKRSNDNSSSDEQNKIWTQMASLEARLATMEASQVSILQALEDIKQAARNRQ